MTILPFFETHWWNSSNKHLKLIQQLNHAKRQHRSFEMTIFNYDKALTLLWNNPLSVTSFLSITDFFSSLKRWHLNASIPHLATTLPLLRYKVHPFFSLPTLLLASRRWAETPDLTSSNSIKAYPITPRSELFPNWPYPPPSNWPYLPPSNWPYPSCNHWPWVSWRWSWCWTLATWLTCRETRFLVASFSN